MVKSVITVIVSALILTGAAIYEQIYVNSAFDRLLEQALIMQEKETNKTATPADAENVRNCWIKEKEKMHAFISHNDIKELDMWLSEGIAFTKSGKYEEAYTKYVVIADLCKSIPKGYLIRFENVF
ncbi:MAG: DUF4363 family protein [Clostridia bacterium]|nr:DUF4363 family protein [Clostridia bacterium]